MGGQTRGQYVYIGALMLAGAFSLPHLSHLSGVLWSRDEWFNRAGARVITQPLSAVLVFVLLSGSAAAGFWLRRWLSETHLSNESLESLRLVTGLLVTFLALVMSLQLSSVKSSFDSAYRDRGLDAAQLAQLDQCLRNYGAEAEPARSRLHEYTAGVIASTWPDEPKPTGVNYPDPTNIAIVGENSTLGALLNEVGLEIDKFAPADSLHQNLAARCRTDYVGAQAKRWTVIEDAHGSVSPLFSQILTFWLMLVFLSFGLQAPRKLLAAIVIGLGVISVSSAMFVIADLDLPYGGLFGIPSTPMRNALADMLR